MNYKQLRTLALVFVALVAFACGGKKEEHHEHAEGKAKEEWKEMDEFHMVMAEAFHPYKDSANLEPVKANAQQLFAAADKWANAPLPEKVDNDEVKTKLQRLKSDAEALNDKVAASDDKTIGDDLTKLHDLFHELQEDWYGGGEGHGHKH